MGVAGQARDQDIGFAARIDEMPDMARMYDIEGAVAHDYLVLAREWADNCAQLLYRLDLRPKLLVTNHLVALP
jgi:hypothetical protein